MEPEDPDEVQVQIRGQVQASGWILAKCQTWENNISKTQGSLEIMTVRAFVSWELLSPRQTRMVGPQ